MILLIKEVMLFEDTIKYRPYSGFFRFFLRPELFSTSHASLAAAPPTPLTELFPFCVCAARPASRCRARGARPPASQFIFAARRLRGFRNVSWGTPPLRPRPTLRFLCESFSRDSRDTLMVYDVSRFSSPAHAALVRSLRSLSSQHAASAAFGTSRGTPRLSARARHFDFCAKVSRGTPVIPS